jgi:hypothetical protein
MGWQPRSAADNSVNSIYKARHGETNLVFIDITETENQPSYHSVGAEAGTARIANGTG